MIDFHDQALNSKLRLAMALLLKRLIKGCIVRNNMIDK